MFSAAVVEVARKSVVESSGTDDGDAGFELGGGAGGKRRAGAVGAGVELDRRGGRGAADDFRVVVVGRRGGNGRAQLRPWRGGGVDAEAADRARLVGRRVGGPHAEAVGTVRERRRRGVGARARAGAEGRGAGVDRALEGGARLGAEAEGRGRVVGQAGGAGVDLDRGRRGVDRPVEARRRRIGVARLVDRFDLEAVGALGEFGVLLGGGAGRPGAAVAAAFEGGDAGAGASVPEKAKSAVALFVSAAGLAVDLGVRGLLSIVQLKEAGVASTLPAASIARTSKVWAPSSVRCIAGGRCRAPRRRRRGGIRRRRRLSRRRRCR